MGFIGEDPKEVEFEPFPEHAPAEPDRTPAPAPAPEPAPEKEPVPA